MYDWLGRMALGYLDEETLDKVIGNYHALGVIAKELRTLNDSLHSRIYADQKREDVDALFVHIIKGNITEAKSSFPQLWPIFLKHDSLANKLANKEVEVELEMVDADAFIKGAIKGKKDAAIGEILDVLSPMFEKKNEQDVAQDELDELLK